MCVCHLSRTDGLHGCVSSYSRPSGGKTFIFFWLRYRFYIHFKSFSSSFFNIYQISGWIFSFVKRQQSPVNCSFVGSSTYVAPLYQKKPFQVKCWKMQDSFCMGLLISSVNILESVQKLRQLS